MNPKVDEYLNKATMWREELEKLRTILLDLPMVEDFKWKHPCYTFQGSNVVIMQDFKDYCALLFIKGALLRDPKGILIQQTANVQAQRQLRFSSLQEVEDLESVIRDYVREAIEVEEAGLKVEYKKTVDFAVPEEFQTELDRNPALKDAFAALTPGRQRAYLLHFSQPKQSKTRMSRIEKCIPRIFDGIGLNDR